MTTDEVIDKLKTVCDVHTPCMKPNLCHECCEEWPCLTHEACKAAVDHRPAHPRSHKEGDEEMTNPITEPLPCRFCGNRPTGHVYDNTDRSAYSKDAFPDEYVALLDCQKCVGYMSISRPGKTKQKAMEACTAAWNDMMDKETQQ